MAVHIFYRLQDIAGDIYTETVGEDLRQPFFFQR